jgi:hypothetical protein
MSRCDLNKRSPRRRKFKYSGICASGIRALAAGFTPCFGARRNIDMLHNTQNLFRTRGLSFSLVGSRVPHSSCPCPATPHSGMFTRKANYFHPFPVRFPF